MIPVVPGQVIIHRFTGKIFQYYFLYQGQHKDYHRPSDDAEWINYDGELSILNYINTLIT